MPEHRKTSTAPASAPRARPHAVTATDVVLRQARKLHRAASNGSIVSALPAARRVHAAGIFPGRALSVSYRERSELRRKHFLRALAVEAGFADWESCRAQLERLPVEVFARFKVEEEWFAYLNSWFSNELQAQAFADRHGGKVIRVGAQACWPRSAHAGCCCCACPPRSCMVRWVSCSSWRRM